MSGWNLAGAEFGDYPASDLPAMLPGWHDASWHNDTCPSMCNADETLQIFCDYADDSKREFQGEKRFHIQSVDDPGKLWHASDDWRDVLAYVLAIEFARVLRDTLPAHKWREMGLRNVCYGKGICASHDFCDANMPMAEAFENVLHVDPLSTASDGNGVSEGACELWGNAWEHAKRDFFCIDGEHWAP